MLFVSSGIVRVFERAMCSRRVATAILGFPDNQPHYSVYLHLVHTVFFKLVVQGNRSVLLCTSCDHCSVT